MNIGKLEKEIKENNGLSEADMAMLRAAVEISDSDGAWAHLEDWGIYVEFEDVDALYNAMWGKSNA